MSEDEACWYILDTRQVVGNCALWWRPKSQGYTCDLNDAGLYTRAEAFSHRSTDVPVHRDVVKAHSVTHVRVEGLWRDEETGARLRAAREEHDERELLRDELDERELEVALEIDPFGDDHGPPVGVTVLRDEIVTAAKVHKCHDCSGEIRLGLRHRNWVEKSESGLLSFRWCHACIKLHVGYPYGEQRESMR